MQSSSSILPRDCPALESIQNVAVKFVKGLRHVPQETALQRLRLFSLVRRRIRSGCTAFSAFHATQCLLPPPALGFEVMLSRFTNGGVKPVACVQRSSSPILEKTARGDCERFIHGDIQVSTGCMMAVPLPRSSPLTRPPLLPPEFFPPCRNLPLCYNCSYSWSSIVVFTAH